SRNLDALALDGRLAQIGVMGGAKAQFNLMPLLQRRLTIMGSTLRARSVVEKAAIARAVHEHVWPLYESGAVRVLVHATFPLAYATEAHRVMDASAHTGKLVLVIDDATAAQRPR